MSKLTIGGQAVIEGVMMRSKNEYAISVRKPNKKISTKVFKLKDYKRIMKIPIVRGFWRLIETISIGMKGLSYSANESMNEEEVIKPWEYALTIGLSLLMTLGLFYAAPLFVASLTKTTGVWFNLVDGITRLLIFFLYLLAISFMPDIKRIFQYHGAEHMTVHAYEKGEKLTVKNVRKYKTLHPRCGTNFILIVFVVSIFVFTLMPTMNYFQRLGLRILLLPFIAGISYEFLRFAGKHFDNPIVKFIVSPGLLLQKITTKPPEDDMIEVAIKSLKALI